MTHPKLSLVLPCYNESEHFTDSIQKIIAVLKRLKLSYEVILIDDKSTDQTRKLIKDFVNRHPELPIKVFLHLSNVGRGQTVSHGIHQALGKYVGYIDIDLEVSPYYIFQCLALLDGGYEVVSGNRQYEFSLSKLPRWFASKVYRILSRIVLHHTFEDTESGYKFFNRKKILPILHHATNPGWFWDTEIILYSGLFGLKVVETEMLFVRRTDKTSTVKLLPDTIDYIKNLLSFRQKLRKDFV